MNTWKKLESRKYKILRGLNVQRFDDILTDRQYALRTNKVAKKHNHLKHLANLRSFNDMRFGEKYERNQ